MRRSLSLLSLFAVSLGLCISPDEPLRLAPSAAEYPRLLQDAEKARTANDFAAAARLLEQAVALNPVEGAAWVRLGRTYYDLKAYDKAIAPYEKGIELGQGFKWGSAYDIACCYALMGKKREALDALERSMKLGWRDLQHMREDEDLVSLRSDPRFIEMAATKDVSKMSRDEGWRYDLWLLNRELRRKHYNIYHKHSKTEFDAFVKATHDAIPKLSNDQIMLRFMELAQMAGDGHTGVRPGDADHFTTPIQMSIFEEGLFITATAPEQSELVGAEVLRVGNLPWRDAANRIERYIPRDNDMTVKALTPRLLSIPRLLHAAGIGADNAALELMVRDAKGQERAVKVPQGGGQVNADWKTARDSSANPPALYMKERSKPYWFEYLADRKLVFFQYNSVRNDARKTTDVFAKELEEFIAENDVEHLVVDVRWNGGGNTFLTPPLLAAIMRSDKVNKPGHLFVITGRNTFSAAMNFTTDLDMRTEAIFVGEPTGSSPNFIGETVRTTLPYSKMLLSISDLYWGRSWPMDYRTWIAPTLYAPPRFALYKENRDPALEAILEYIGTGPSSAK